MDFNKKDFQIRTFLRSLIAMVCICFFAAPAFAQYDLSGAVSVKNQKQTASAALYNGSSKTAAQTAPSTMEPRLYEAIPQNKSVKGTVVNAADGTPVPGAVVQVVGTNKYATTDADGKFTINNGGKPVSIQCLGFKTLTVSNLTDGMTIKMTAELVKLDDVVVVGYGSQKKVTLTGSVTSTKGEVVEKNSAVNLSQGLAGRLPGVIINNRSGEPGADGTTIFIRGRSTTGDNSPLIIIDGIAGRENLDRINPEDIESITVLKDASAAIYGSRSANGVILVTTKRGQVDQKPVITFSYDLGIQHATRLPDLCNALQFATAYNQCNADQGAAAAFGPDEIKMIEEGTNKVEYPNTDWFHEIIKKASFQHKFGLTISGGTKTMNYFISANGQMQDGIYRKSATKYDLAGFRANIDTKVAKNLKVGVDVSARQQHKDYSAYSSDNYGIFYVASRLSPLTCAYYPNGYAQSGSNPAVWVTDQTGYDKTTLRRLNTTLTARLDMPFVTEGLWVEAHAAYDVTSQFEKIWSTPWWGYNYNKQTGEYDHTVTGSTSKLYEYYTTDHQMTLNATINYDRTFLEKHHVSAMFGVEQNKYHKDYFMAANMQYDSDAIDQLFAGSSDASNYKINGTAAETARRSYFGRINYDYEGKYMISGIFRYDGSQNFPDGHRWGFFPGVSAGWRISEEPFIKDNFNWVNNLKFRVSYGEVGNDNIAAFQYLTTFVSSNKPVFGGAIQSSIIPGTIPNTNVTWETAKTWNIGLDGTLWNGKLGFEFEVFKTKRSDILITRNSSIPNYTGMSSSNLPDENIGKVENKGFELQLSHANTVNSDFYYRISGNFTFAKNKVLYMDETPWSTYDENGNITVDRSYMNQTGRPMGAGLYYHVIGMFKTQEQLDKYPHFSGQGLGDLIFADLDGDGKITSNDRYRNQYNTIPQIVYGLTFEGKWKDFDFMILFQGQARARLYLGMNNDPAVGNIYKAIYADAWSTANTTGSNPRMRSTYNGGAYASDYYFKKASFLRLKNVEIGYNFHNELFKKMGISNLRVYIGGYNLYTWSPLKEIDPETNSTDLQSYPQVRVFNTGVKFTF